MHIVHCAKYCLFLTKGAALLADITKKIPIYVHFVEKLQIFDLRALGGSFCRKFGWGAFYTFLWPGPFARECNMWSTLSGTSSGDKFHFSALPSRQTGWVSLLPWALSHHVQGQASEQSKHPGCCCNNHYLSVKPLLIQCRFLTIVNTMPIFFGG